MESGVKPRVEFDANTARSLVAVGQLLKVHHCVADGAAASESERRNPLNYKLTAGDVCNPEEKGQCGDGKRCLYYEALPRSGTMGFDSMGGALVALLQAVTFDDYDQTMHAMQQAFSPWAFVYFVLVIVICGFFIIKCVFCQPPPSVYPPPSPFDGYPSACPRPMSTQKFRRAHEMYVRPHLDRSRSPRIRLPLPPSACHALSSACS